MTAVFELLFKYRPLLYERGQIAFHPIWPWYVTGLLAALAIACAYLLYRRSELPRRWRCGLSVLRAATFLVLLFIFLQPVLRLRSVIPQKNFVAIAYDLSKSMEIRDGPQGQSRLDSVKHLLRQPDNPLLADLAGKFKLRFFRFSGSAERTEAFADQTRRGEITDLERTLRQIEGEMATAPIAGIVMITDGADNRSKDLNAAASQLRARNIRVYTVGIGASGFLRDTEVLRVTAPKRVLKDTIVESEVSVKSNGYPGRRTRLVVLDRDRQLQSQEITMGSDGEVKTHKVNFSSTAAGPRVFTFRLEPFADERIPQNNDQTALIRVEDEQPPVLYVEGEPRWEFAFLRRAVLSDKNLHLVTLLRQADGKFYRQGGLELAAILEKGFPTEKADLFKFKGMILGSVEASFFTFDQLRMIADFVSQRGGGFLMLGGKNSYGPGGYLNTPIEDMLPVQLGQNPRGMPEFSELEYKVRLTAYGSLHPITRLSLSAEDNRKRWDAAPALIGFSPTAGPKPGATVLAQGSTPDSKGQSPVILAFQRFGKGKSAAFMTASSWRWKMEQEHSNNFHELFWKQMLRWLVSDALNPVTIGTEEDSYSLDESVSIRAEVNDASFAPLNNARIYVQVKAPSGQRSTVPLSWDVEKDGAYSGGFKPEEEGIYEIASEAFQGSRSLGTATSNFRVAQSAEEFHNAAMNADLLKRLSADTGGRYYSPKDIRTLAEDISYVDTGSSRLEEKDLWDMPFLFLVLVGLISAEWILRKRKGLA
jgi:uncharacterized membrane protein